MTEHAPYSYRNRLNKAEHIAGRQNDGDAQASDRADDIELLRPILKGDVPFEIKDCGTYHDITCSASIDT